jgi:hypothetical protein
VLEYRRHAKTGLNPRYNARRDIPTLEEVARQVHIDRLPSWKYVKHGAQWINTLADYGFPQNRAAAGVRRRPARGAGLPFANLNSEA